jgi:hypothetical protein
MQPWNHFTFFSILSTFPNIYRNTCDRYSVYSQEILKNWWSRNMGNIQLPFATLWGQKVMWSCKSSVQYHAYSFSSTARKNRVKITARHTLCFIVQHNSMQSFSWTQSARTTAARKARNAGCSYVVACETISWLLHLPVLGNKCHITIYQYMKACIFSHNL